MNIKRWRVEKANQCWHGLKQVFQRWPSCDFFRSPFSVRRSFSVPFFAFCVLKFHCIEIAHLRRFRACLHSNVKARLTLLPGQLATPESPSSVFKFIFLGFVTFKCQSPSIAKELKSERLPPKVNPSRQGSSSVSVFYVHKGCEFRKVKKKCSKKHSKKQNHFFEWLKKGNSL